MNAISTPLPTTEQQAVIDKLVDFLLAPAERLFVFKGYAGVGKTFTLNHALAALKAIKNLNTLMVGHKPTEQFFVPSDPQIYITATTNKAAAVLSESMSDYEVTTIYSAANIKLANDYRTGSSYLTKNKNWVAKPNSIVIVDEASYLTEQGYKLILESFPKSKIILVGDPAQLIMDMDARNPAADVFSLPVQTAQLTKIMRNNGGITEISAAYRNAVETGVFPKLETLINGEDVIHLNGNEFQEAVNTEFSRPEWTPADSKILAWTNNHVRSYNDYIAKLRDLPVLPTEGNYYLVNSPVSIDGELLISADSIIKLDKTTKSVHENAGIKGQYFSHRKSRVFIPDSWDDANRILASLRKQAKWSIYFRYKEGWADLRLPFASTVHKSQGSTYDKVFIDLTDIGNCTDPDTLARMLYVACSRPKTKIYLYGSLPTHFGG